MRLYNTTKNEKTLLLIGLIITSFDSQTNLETLKVDANISSTLEKYKNIDFGLVAYVTEDIENFKSEK